MSRMPRAVDSPDSPDSPDTPVTPPGGGSPEARALTAAVTRLRRALRASIRTEYPWEQLPMAQVELLQVCVEHSPVRVSELAARTRLAQSTVSGLIAQLTMNGLVSRGVDSEDRRAAAVSATDSGRLRLAAWTRAHERRLEHALTALPDADRAALHVALPALTRLAARLEEADQSAGKSAD
ncbi:MarR family winged helix-turn-helix transcriptional regulator [Streptomyces sp. AP-93]|uniref:MarR family winged helix-turn-helix transcriptional regulator n=1 Tax=Streptomyces sp. AP-93 TaxID=2929048 RepID=UPI001FAF53AA|nr:MarR family winged helix-turn-helix transcriptional regulator [Streptomyces sp. AP-93]MCJ0873403.1 MarR family winged helix-turn-helix transcriptional regulator [Streptomyces sp. AP-93]